VPRCHVATRAVRRSRWERRADTSQPRRRGVGGRENGVSAMVGCIC
jgi:hypothetical protein